MYKLKGQNVANEFKAQITGQPSRKGPSGTLYDARNGKVPQMNRNNVSAGFPTKNCFMKQMK
jgi:hypothetical protein